MKIIEEEMIEDHYFIIMMIKQEIEEMKEDMMIMIVDIQMIEEKIIEQDSKMKMILWIQMLMSIKELKVLKEQ